MVVVEKKASDPGVKDATAVDAESNADAAVESVPDENLIHSDCNRYFCF